LRRAPRRWPPTRRRAARSSCRPALRGPRSRWSAQGQRLARSRVQAFDAVLCIPERLRPRSGRACRWTRRRMGPSDDQIGRRRLHRRVVAGRERLSAHLCSSVLRGCSEKGPPSSRCRGTRHGPYRILENRRPFLPGVRV
jgi:hypothetical protein